MVALEKRVGRWLGPATEADVMAAEETLGLVFPPEYRAFILKYGSGIVGSYEIYGLGCKPTAAPHLLWLIDDLEKAGIKRRPQVIPFHAEGDGDYSAILAAPLAGHATGSIVYWSPRRDEVLDLRPAHRSLDEWFSARLA